MKDNIDRRRLEDLLVVLERLTELHNRLLEHIRAKIDHMRAADTTALNEDTQRETALLKVLQEQEGLRRQLINSIVPSLDLDPENTRGPSLDQVAERVEPELGRRLRASGERLRETVAEVSEINRIAELIARQVLGHLRCVFQAVATLDDPPNTYAPRSQTSTSTTRTLFDMTG